MLNGKDIAGNEVTVQKKVISLDLDMPISPVINSNSGYNILSEYGIRTDITSTITYDSRKDIVNYYSINNGVTWLTYTGPFEIASGTIIAKSVKKTTGLEVSVSKTIIAPSDSMGSQAYDKNDATYITNVTNKYIAVDSNIYNKLIRVKWESLNAVTTVYLRFLDENRQEISSVSRTSGTFDETYTVPVNTKWIKYESSRTSNEYGKLFEIYPSNAPKYTVTNGYMLLHVDPTKAINSLYQTVSIAYAETSVQRLYKIGTSGVWLDYQDQPINLPNGQTIYAKGIDQYGSETRTIPSYTASLPDALGSAAYDNDDATYITNVTNKYVSVDSSVQGKPIRVKWSSSNAATIISLRFLDENKQEISVVSRNGGAFDETYIVPLNTKFIRYESTYVSNEYGKLYQIQISNEPKFSVTSDNYMVLNADSASSVTEPYQMVSISYFLTSVQNLYRVGTTGDWLTYQNQPVKVKQGETLYAKGIDKYGIETRIISSYTANIADALKKEVLDNNDTTFVTNVTNQYMQVDSSMQGKNIRVKWYSYRVQDQSEIKFLDENKQYISSAVRVGAGTFDTIYTVPLNTKWIKYEAYSSFSYIKLYDIRHSI